MAGRRDLSALAGRPGWTVEKRAAVYRPAGADWVGRVAELPQAVRASRSWHGAILRGGVAVYTVEVIDVLAAAEWVERHHLTPEPAPTPDR